MKILMLCHDRQIDRRIMVQAESLINLGHHVTLLALPLPTELNHKEGKTLDNFVLHRIGVKDILSAQDSMITHLKLDRIINQLLPKLYQFPRFFRFLLNIYRFKPKMLAKIKFYFGGSPSLVMNAIFNFKSSFIQEGLKHDFDLVQVHDLPLLEAGVELAKAKNCLLVYDAHELFPEQKMYRPQTKDAFIQHERKYIQACDLVFTVNESIADEMAKRYSIKKPQVVVNALNPPRDFVSQTRVNRLRQHLSISEDRQIILMQGGLGPHRNLENLVKAFAEVKTNTAVLVVMGSGILEKKLIKIAKKLKLYQERVYFLPAVPQDDLLYFTASADLGIIPYPPLDLNTYYCTPNKLFEFIQAGLPILANDLPELRRYVQETDFGMVHPMHTPEEIAAGIDIALAQLAEKAWQDNLKSQKDLYSWKIQSHIYVEAMQQLMERTGV